MMMGTKGRYAVMAMVDLARMPADMPVTLAEISDRQEIALSYLEQLFNKLRRRGLVKSVRGPGGGYILARHPSHIPIADIVAAVRESLKMTRCHHAGGGCLSDNTRCLTHDLWEGLEERIDAYLRSVTLEDVCRRRVAPSRKHEALSAMDTLGVYDASPSISRL